MSNSYIQWHDAIITPYNCMEQSFDNENNIYSFLCNVIDINIKESNVSLLILQGLYKVVN